VAVARPFFEAFRCIQDPRQQVDVAGRRVLTDATFIVALGDKVGLVGRNGVGKTSLLKVVAGEDDPAGGLVLRRGTLGYVPQNPRPRAEAAQTALSHILSGRGLDRAAVRLAELHRALEQDHSIASIERYSEAEERYRLDGGYSGESEARRISAGLGLRLDRVDLALGVLSGGERRRVELARVLFADPELLLLDEPTNHLDSNAKSWLMDFLRDYRGGVIVVSHDLGLLDTSITRVLHLDAGRLIEYRGTYSQYQRARELEDAYSAQEQQHREHGCNDDDLRSPAERPHGFSAVSWLPCDDACAVEAHGLRLVLGRAHLDLLGLIGGLGPESTIDYYRRIIEAWGDENPRSSPHVLIDSLDVDYGLKLVEHDRPALVDYLLQSVRCLAAAGCDFAAMAANTPHVVFDDLVSRSPIPLVSMR